VIVGAARCAPQSLQNLAPAGFSCLQIRQLTGPLPNLSLIRVQVTPDRRLAPKNESG